MIKIFIGGFSAKVSEVELVQHVARYVDVVTVKIVRDRATKRSKGFGFIEIKDTEDIDAVIDALNGTFIGEDAINVNRVIEQPAAKPSNFRRSGFQAPRNDGPKRPRRPRI